MTLMLRLCPRICPEEGAACVVNACRRTHVSENVFIAHPKPPNDQNLVNLIQLFCSESETFLA